MYRYLNEDEQNEITDEDGYNCRKCGKYVPNVMEAPECSLDSLLCIQCWNEEEEA